MDRLYKLRMSGMAEAFEKQLLEPNTGLEPFEVRFADKMCIRDSPLQEDKPPAQV